MTLPVRWSLLLPLAACSSPQPRTPGVLMGGIDNLQHDGPLVSIGGEGTARFAGLLLAAFRIERAMTTVAYADGFYRARANEGYEAVLDQIESDLRALGFGSKSDLQLEVLEEWNDDPAWTPRRARLSLVVGSDERSLLAFGPEDDASRTMLPVGAPSCEVEGALCFELDDLVPGQILVTREPLEAVLDRAAERGATAVLSAWLAEENRDPSGRERHRPAIRSSSVPAGTRLPVANVSTEAYEALESATSGARARFVAEVELATHPLRTLVATIVGSRLPDEVVAIAADVRAPGAVDNASGVAGLLEGVTALSTCIASGSLAPPARSLSFVWGHELEMSKGFLEHTERRVVAAFASTMTGASREESAAVTLLERAPDPGVLAAPGQGGPPLPDIHPSGISIVARSALLDVGLLADGWTSREDPWKGGGDEDVFLARAIPAVCIRHDSDYAHRTSLDRLPRVDGQELALTSCALFAAALAIADPQPIDLERHLRTLSLERRMRLHAAREAGDAAIEAAWETWFLGARDWLRRLCLDLPFDGPAELPRPADGADG